MTNQWIVAPGPFIYNYRWLTSGARGEVKQFADRAFADAYGVQPDTVTVL